MSGCRSASSASVRSAVPERVRAEPAVTHTMSCVSISMPRLVRAAARSAVHARDVHAERRDELVRRALRARPVVLGGEEQPRRRHLRAEQRRARPDVAV